MMSTPNTNNNDIQVHTPRFGACFHAKDPVRRCALTPADCHDGHEVYISAYVLQHAVGQETCLAKDVRVGRCVSQNTCAPSEDACYQGDFYVSPHQLLAATSYKKTCTMVREEFKNEEHGSGPLRATTYPECVSPQGDAKRCVIDGSFCNSKAGEVLHEQTSRCKCQDVVTGVCYPTETAVHDIGPSNSFCAVHAEDCPANTHSFLNATSLHSDQMKCRLCQEGNNHPTSFPAGACQQTRGSNAKHSLQKCALESKDCDDPLGSYEFLSANTILQEYGLYCPASHAENSMGYCVEEDADFNPEQANHACVQKKYCSPQGYTFLPQEDCTLAGKSDDKDEAVTKVPAYFGKCVSQQTTAFVQPEGNRCVWDPSECQSSEKFQAPPTSSDADEDWDCTCDKVYTGACKLPGENGDDAVHHCAVSKWSCQDPTTFVPPTLLPLHVREACRLCPPVPEPTVAPTTLAPSANAPVAVATATKAPTLENYGPGNLLGDQEGVGSVAGLYWAIVLVVLAAVVLITVVTLRLFRQKQRQSKAKEAAVHIGVDVEEDYSVRVPEMT